MTGLGPFDLTGTSFLSLYGALLAIALIFSLLVPRVLRPDGRSGVVEDPERLAYLAGGAVQYVDALVARMLVRGAVSIDRKQGVTMLQPPSEGAKAAEITLLGLSSPAKYSTIDKQLAGYAEHVRDQLVQAGLLMDRSAVRSLRLWQALPFVVLIVFGAIKWEIGTQRGKPVLYLAILLGITLGFALFRLIVVDRRTRAGITVLDEARRRRERLRRAAPGDEASTAVALFGTSALIGSAWSDLHQLRRQGENGGDGGSSGNGGGDGGGCGGGCGGCGG